MSFWCRYIADLLYLYNTMALQLLKKKDLVKFNLFIKYITTSILALTTSSMKLDSDISFKSI